jgi:hypothetical protein
MYVYVCSGKIKSAVMCAIECCQSVIKSAVMCAYECDRNYNMCVSVTQMKYLYFNTMH